VAAFRFGTLFPIFPSLTPAPPRHAMGMHQSAAREDVGEVVPRPLKEQACALTVILSLTEPQVDRSASFLCYCGETGTRERAARSARCDAGGRSKRYGASEAMTGRLVKLILQRMCSHRFSWPHSGVDGQDYQVCLICGTAYEYDLVTMRRVRRLESPPPAAPESKDAPRMTVG
jgi:hypothetical protein